MQKMRTEKGITLIALIITIIVMLILVGVSVTVALKGGLFTAAKNAANNTKLERDNELAISNGDIIDKHLSESGSVNETANGKWKQNGETITDGTTTLIVGDIINYDEGTSGSYRLDGSEGVVVTYYSEEDETVSIKPTTFTVNGENGTFEAGDLGWKVLGVNHNGQIELVATKCTGCDLSLYGSSTTKLEIENVMNDYCNSLYGKGEKSVGARNIYIDDVLKVMNSYEAVDEYYEEFNVSKEIVFSTEQLFDIWNNGDGQFPNEFVYPDLDDTFTLLPVGEWPLISGALIVAYEGYVPYTWSIDQDYSDGKGIEDLETVCWFSALPVVTLEGDVSFEPVYAEDNVTIESYNIK